MEQSRKDTQSDQAPLALATLLNNLPGMAYRCRSDRRRTMLFASEGSLDLTGYRPADLIENRVVAYGDLIHLEDRTMVNREIEAALAERRPYRCIYRIKAADGQEKWMLDKGEATDSAADPLLILEGFITDHTERVEAYQRLEQQVADRTRKLTALYDVLEAAADPGDLQTAISRTLGRVLKAIKAEAASIHLLDESGETLQLMTQQGMREAVTVKISRISVQESQLAGWIVRHKEPLLISGIKDDPRTADLVSDGPFSVYIGVPIVAHERVQGVLTLLSEDISRYTAKEEMELLISVGEQIGVVVENARLRQQAEQLIVLEERNRLARELHDSVTQSLYSVTLFAEAGRALAQSGELERATRYFNDVLDTGQQALKEMRLLVHKLRPTVLEQEGLIRALQHRLNAVEGRAGVKNQLDVNGTISLTAEIEECLYHVSQEALNNAIKHAHASEVRVILRQDDQETIEMIVVDNGQGFEPETAASGGGLGLTSMEERVTMLGGDISVQSTIGQGTRVVVRLPVTHKQ